MTKLLLIDNRVRSIEYITRSLEEEVDFIIFDYEKETVESLTSQIHIKPYETIGIVQDQDNIPSYTLAKPMGDYDLNDYSTWTTYRELLGWCVSNLGIKYWDLIECNIDDTWQPVISSLQTEFSITIRSSSKQLGNTTAGDNWVFDDGTSLIGIYFTTAINDYPYTLGTAWANLIQTYLDKDGVPWVQPNSGNYNTTFGLLGQGNYTAYSSSNFMSINLTDCVQCIQIDGGQIFLKRDGTCYSCGLNRQYRLGLANDTLNYNTPTLITFPTGTAPIKYITAGYAHSFFLASDNNVYVCGINGWNATTLDNPQDNRSNPLTLTLSNVYLINSWRDNTMVVFLNNQNVIYYYGVDQLVNFPLVGDFYTKISPYRVLTTVDSINIKQIECGGPTIYYVDINNNLYGYGWNGSGQLGQGNTKTLNTWKQILGPSNVLSKNVLSISSSEVNLQIITLSLDLYICGYYTYNTTGNTNGFDNTPQLTTLYTTTPIKCQIGKLVTSVYSTIIEPGFPLIGAIYTTEGKYGYLKTNSTTTEYLYKSDGVTPISAITNTNDVITSQSSLSLIDTTGSIWVIGTNFYGASNVTLTNGYNKVTKAFGSPVIKVTNTSRGNLVLLQNGDVWAFGYNQYGELGTTVSADTSSPVGSGAGVKLSFGANTIKFIASSLHHSLFITTTGTVYSCGLNNYGQLAQGTTTNVTTPTITSLTNIKSCCCGLYYSFFLSSAASPNATYTFYGYNGNNESGGSSAQYNNFFKTGLVNGGYNTLITSGFNHSITSVIVSGVTTHYTSGLNNYGQYGLGNTNVYSTATTFKTSNFIQLFAGENRSAGITNTGALYTWGRNIDAKAVLTDINVTTVYQVTDIGIIYIKNNKYYVAYASDILAPYSPGPISNITAYNTLTNPLTIYSNICFLEGTQVKCDQGLIEIEKINPDLHTISKKKIVAITETYSTEKELVVLEKDSLRPNVPNQTTVITLEHKVFYKGKMIEASKVTKKRQKYNGELLYNVLMEEHNKMSVNNMIVETLDPANTIGKVFKGLREYRA